MMMYTKYHINNWDIISRHPTDLDLYQNNWSELNANGFKLSNSLDYEDDSNAIEDNNDAIYELFKIMPIRMITIQQGTK